MKHSTSELFAAFEETGLFSSRVGEAEWHALSPVESCGPGDLVFVDRKEFVPYVQQNRPAAAVVSEAIETQFGEALGVPRLVATQVRLAHALIKQRYMDRDIRAEGWSGIHPGAIVHPDARLGDSVLIGPGAVIGRQAQLGDNAIVMANAVIEDGASIGAGTVIHPAVVIGYGCRLGERVIVQSGAIIGAEGYGFAQDRERRNYRIPQTGTVIIEDDVSIGANCCIDRATYGETRIGRGSKLDNLCHIAHNAVIGEDCLLTAGCTIAGSTTLGNRVVASGQTGILDHLHIADDVTLLHRAGVTENIGAPGAYAGLPVQPLPEYLKNTAVARQLTGLRKSLRELEKRLQALSEAGRPPA